MDGLQRLCGVVCSGIGIPKSIVLTTANYRDLSDFTLQSPRHRSYWGNCQDFACLGIKQREPLHVKKERG